jgi:two-component sensor histidine kinase
MDSCVRAIYRIDASADGPARARRIVASELSAIVPRKTMEELELMVSELVTNGIKYGARDENEPITLDLRVGRYVRCTVIDPGPGFPAEHAVEEPGGWGLKVVAWLADRWGVTRARDGTRVWFETKPD